MKDRRKNNLFIFGILLFLAGFLICEGKNPQDKAVERQFFAMDTYMTLKAYGAGAEEGIEKAEKEIRRLEAILSVTEKSSEVYDINEQGGGILSQDTQRLLNRSLELYQETDGLFDVTIYPLMELWGFSTKKYHVPSEAELQEILPLVDGAKIFVSENRIKLSAGQRLDFGGIGKGYAADQVMKILKEEGVENALISLGGNIGTLGVNEKKEPWVIGIRDPNGTGEEMIGSVRVSGKFVVTSGGYERYFEEDGKTYIHILDPKTGYPAEQGLISATIVSEDGTLADALSTAVYLMGLEKASAYWKEHREVFDMILVAEDGKVYVTQGIADDFESTVKFEVLR